MKELLIVAAVVVAMTGSVAARGAIPPAQRCANTLGTYEIVNGGEIDMVSESPDALLASDATLARSRSMIAKCAPGPARDAVTAYVVAETAAIKHRRGSFEWRDDANRARQLFARCIRAYEGTTHGAKCETARQRVTGWLATWSG